jgi:hypothetical protein
MSSEKRLVVAGKEYPLYQGDEPLTTHKDGFEGMFLVREAEPLPPIVGGDWPDYPSCPNWDDDNPPPEPEEYSPPKVLSNGGAGRPKVGVKGQYDKIRTPQDEEEIARRKEVYRKAYASQGGWRAMPALEIKQQIPMGFGWYLIKSPLPGKDTRPKFARIVKGTGEQNPSMRMLRVTQMSKPHAEYGEVDNS